MMANVNSGSGMNVLCQLLAFGHLTSTAVVLLPVLSYTVTSVGLVSRSRGHMGPRIALSNSKPSGDWEES
jgi:hypothetical protein